MQIKIVNNTNLSFKEIGEIIDKIIKNSVGTTHYYKQIELFNVVSNTEEIRVQIYYLKKYCVWTFTEK